MDAHKNFAYSLITVAPAPASSGTSMTVADGTVFPSAPFNATVWPVDELPLAANAEIVRVTNIAGNVLTVTRAQESSSARTIVVGDQIAATVTNKTLTDIESAIPSTAGLISAINVSAGGAAENLSALTFSNGGGVSFGLNASVVTATVATNYQSQGAYLTTAALSQDSSKYAGTNGAITGGSITVNTSGISVNLPAYLTTAQPVGAYLTTAALSQDSSKYAFTGFTSTTIAGAVVAGTHDTQGLKLAVPAFLTTAQSPGAYLTTAALSQDSSKYAATGFTTTTAAGAVIAGTHDTLGLKLGVPAFLTTAQPVGAYLTTARASNDAIGLNTALTANGVAWTVNSSGLSLNVPAFLTTAALSADSSKYAATGFTTTTVAGDVIAGTLNTQGLKLAVPSYLTAAPGGGITNIKVSAGTLSAFRSDISFNDSNGISFGLATNGVITGTVDTYTAVTFSNSNGVSFGIAGSVVTATVKTDYLTTAMQSNAATISNIRVSAGAGNNLLSAMTFANSNNISFGINASTLTASVVPPGTLSMWPFILPGSTAVSTYYAGSTSQGGGGGSTQTGVTHSLYVVPMPLAAALAFSELRMGMSNTRSTAGTGSATHVYSAGIYTNNAGTLSLVKGYYGGIFVSQNSVTAQTFRVWTATTGSNSVGGAYAGIRFETVYSSQGNISANSQIDNGLKFVRIDDGVATTLTECQYYLAFGLASVSSGVNLYSNAGVLQSNAISSLHIPDLGRENSTQTSNYLPAWGAISTTYTSVSNAATFFPLPNAIAISNMSMSNSAWQRFHLPFMRNHS